MKRYLMALGLAVTMVATLASCGNTDGNTNSGTNGPANGSVSGSARPETGVPPMTAATPMTIWRTAAILLTPMDEYTAAGTTTWAET